MKKSTRIVKYESQVEKKKKKKAAPCYIKACKTTLLEAVFKEFFYCLFNLRSSSNNTF